MPMKKLRNLELHVHYIVLSTGQAFREKYTLSKTIGRGACGEVKLAFEKDSCQKFAVKVISKKTFSMGVSQFSAVKQCCTV